MKNRNYFLNKGGDDYFRRSIYGLRDGARLSFIQNKFKIDAYGIDPSRSAIRNTKHFKSHCKIGTADSIPFVNKKFDLVLFGQSMMYFDDDLLPKIVSETFKILNDKSYILINDFYSKKIQYKTYKHYKQIKIRKMDNSKIFSWHPYIKPVKQKIYLYKNLKKKDNLVSLQLLKFVKKN
jgi:ubiquinone/menaquinone biosynthesis C-methylase UbiE